MKYVKKITALMVAFSIVVLSSICTFSQESETDSMNSTDYYKVLDKTITLDDNEVFVSSYGLTENSTCSVDFMHKTENRNYVFFGQNYVDGPMIYTIGVKGEYELFVCNAFGGQGSQDRTFSFEDTHGVYQKVRFKLSCDPHFNYDGSYTFDGYDCYFDEDFTVSESTYSSALVIISGGCISFVAPDENGCVEFYASTRLGVDTEFFTVYSKRTYTDEYPDTEVFCGEFGKAVQGFRKGLVDNNTEVNIIDVTSIQRYIAKQVEFYRIQKYRADVNNDNEVSIFDATAIQMYLAKIENAG